MNPIGILQGRLSPEASGRPQAFPRATWRTEFALARDCGFSAIEWLVTSDRAQENPLWTDRGVAEIQEVAAATEVRVPSVCLDYFVSMPFVRAGEPERTALRATLEHLIYQSASLGARVALLPLLESNEIRTERDVDDVLRVLAGPLALADRLGISLALESGLPAVDLLALVRRADSPALGVYYDTGNAAAVGHAMAADVRTIGPHLLGVHIKDRARGGPNVRLGQGDVSFLDGFEALLAVAYDGPLILETVRDSDAVSSARSNLVFVARELVAAQSART